MNHNAAVRQVRHWRLPCYTMTRTPRGGRRDATNAPGTSMLGIKGVTPELRKRLKIACVEEGVRYADLIDKLLDERDAREIRRKRSQASPLHRPPPEHLDPGTVAL